MCLLIPNKCRFCLLCVRFLCCHLLCFSFVLPFNSLTGSEKEEPKQDPRLYHCSSTSWIATASSLWTSRLRPRMCRMKSSRCSHCGRQEVQSWHTEAPSCCQNPHSLLPSPPHLHRGPQQQPKDAFQLVHCLFCWAQATRGQVGTQDRDRDQGASRKQAPEKGSDPSVCRSGGGDRISSCSSS